MPSEIIIIGAGMTGLACARRLAQAGLKPLVLDKGRGIGGRMATRRVKLAAGEISFDHGAQYFTARAAAFAEAMRGLDPTCARWDDGAVEPHLVGVPGMSSVPRAMAAGLEVRLETAVTAARATSGGWELDVGEKRLETQHLVITVPAPQAAALVGPDHPIHARIAGIAMAPCLTLMAAFANDAPRPFAARVADGHPLAWIAHDGSKPGRAGALTNWVAQASAAWSEQHLEMPAEVLAERMLPMLAEVIGVAPEMALHAAAHRWRYARPIVPLGQPFLSDDTGTLHVGGDWCLGARVEAAWLSGTAIADAIVAQVASGGTAISPVRDPNRRDWGARG